MGRHGSLVFDSRHFCSAWVELVWVGWIKRRWIGCVLRRLGRAFLFLNFDQILLPGLRPGHGSWSPELTQRSSVH